MSIPIHSHDASKMYMLFIKLSHFIKRLLKNDIFFFLLLIPCKMILNNPNLNIYEMFLCQKVTLYSTMYIFILDTEINFFDFFKDIIFWLFISYLLRLKPCHFDEFQCNIYKFHIWKCTIFGEQMFSDVKKFYPYSV